MRNDCSRNRRVEAADANVIAECGGGVRAVWREDPNVRLVVAALDIALAAGGGCCCVWDVGAGLSSEAVCGGGRRGVGGA